ncbi:kinetochore protein Nuf2 isoform X2 [Dendropsophus ebraccatus]
MMDKLTFPQFPVVELVNFFRLKVLTGAEAKNFTKNDIYPNPKPEWLLKLFIRVLQKVFDIWVEQFYMLPLDIDVQHPHLIEGFAPVTYTVKVMTGFLPMCLIYDFHPSDVLNPKGKRTLYLLSGIVNFLHFRDTRKIMYTGVCQNYRMALDNINQQQRTIQELEAKIEKLTTVPPEQQAEFKALSKDISDLQQSINQEYRTKDLGLQDKIAHQKADFAEKMKKLNQHKLNIATMKEEQERMKSQIVESPEQRKNKTERMKENVHRLKQARKETSEKCDHYRERVTVASLWQSEVQAYNNKLHSIETHLDMYRKVLEETRQKEEQIINKNLELKSIGNEETQLKRTNLIKKEKLAKMDIKNQKKLEDFEHRKNEILEICSHIQEKRQAVHGRVSHVLQEIQQTNSKKEQLLDTAEEGRKRYQHVTTGFRNALEKYHDSMQKATDRSAERRREKVAELHRWLSRR